MSKKKHIKNVCGLDKVVRAVFGVAAIAVGVFRLFGGGFWGYIIIAAGVILIITAATGFCGIYTIFGISTCKDG